jgi:DNA polymerase (family 10)
VCASSVTPPGRLLGKREPHPLDMSEVIKAARDHGALLEINAQPDRLDLIQPHRLCRC